MSYFFHNTDSIGDELFPMAIKEFVHFGLCRVLIMLHFHSSVEWRAESNLFRLIALLVPGR